LYVYIALVCVIIFLYITLGEMGYYVKYLEHRIPDISSEKKEPAAGFFWHEINQRIEDGSSWLVIDGKIYDVENFERHHPGGAALLEDYVGTDATRAFFGAIVSSTPVTAKLRRSIYTRHTQESLFARPRV
jgi:Cytochrome b5-like Heme/Steroid binding domain